MVEPGKTETRLKLQAEHRKNLREFEKKIVTELDEKVNLPHCFVTVPVLSLEQKIFLKPVGKYR